MPVEHDGLALVPGLHKAVEVSLPILGLKDSATLEISGTEKSSNSRDDYPGWRLFVPRVRAATPHQGRLKCTLGS
jgi:hypothetical protein